MVTSLVQGLTARKGQRPWGPSDQSLGRSLAALSSPPAALAQLPRGMSGAGFKGSMVGVYLSNSPNSPREGRLQKHMPSVSTWLPGSSEALNFSGFRTPGPQQ